MWHMLLLDTPSSPALSLARPALLDMSAELLLCSVATLVWQSAPLVHSAAWKVLANNTPFGAHLMVCSASE
jgi:hypothetical protein